MFIVCMAIAQLAISAPGRPVVQLSTALLPEGVGDEQAYAKWLADQTAELLDAAEQTENLRDRIEFRVAAANWILARECEPFMSRWLNGIEREASAAQIVSSTQRAIGQLSIARADWHRYSELDDHDSETAVGFDSSIETLEAFAEALHACVLPPFGDGDVARSAARKLSEHLEDDRPAVAAAAVLWQGVLYGNADRVDRALRLLPPAATPPASETLQYAFFAKLLRCKHLARNGSYAAAWRLLLAIEERSQEWFVTLRRRAEAGRAAMLVKFDICEAWSTAGDDAKNEATRAWCDETLSRIREEHFPAAGDLNVARLATAAPMIVPLPDTKTEEVAVEPPPEP